MIQREVERYLKRLKVEVVDELNGWVRCRCPFAQWKHDSRYDNEQRFGVTHDEDDASYFNCFVCGEKGPFSVLPGRLGKLRGDQSLAAIGTQIERDEILGTETVFGDWDETEAPKKSTELRIRTFPSRKEFFSHPPANLEPDALRYLSGRGIHFDTVTKLALRYDRARERILFPVLDYWTGRYIGCSGRLIWSEKKRVAEEQRRTEIRQRLTGEDKRVTIPKVRDYSGLEKRKAFLGTYGRPGLHVSGLSQRDDRTNSYWILCEGLLAYARFVQLGFRDNTLAILGSKLTVEKAELLRHSGRAIYYFTDPDKAGRVGLYGNWNEDEQTYEGGGALDMLYGDVIQYVPQWPEGLDDPDNIEHRDQVIDMMQNAELWIRSR